MYTVYYSDNAGFENAASVYSYENSIQLTSLIYGKTYYIKVVASASDGLSNTSPESEVFSFEIISTSETVLSS